MLEDHQSTEVPGSVPTEDQAPPASEPEPAKKTAAKKTAAKKTAAKEPARKSA
jgi:topoisomerase IA-like protein